MPGMRRFECFGCGRVWEEPYGTGRPASCPSCGSLNIHRAAGDRGGWGAGGRCRRPYAGGRGRGRYA